MIEREDIGTWMDGPPRPDGYVPGEDLGLPPRGPGSVAPVGRRFAGYLIDWVICFAASRLLSDGSPVLTWPLFAGMCVILQSLVGASVGQIVMGLRVAPVARRWPMPVRALVRTGLLLLLIPTLVWNRDAQPLQDVAAGTAVVRR